MNNWLNKLERKYGRYGIPNLTNILVAGQILVLAIELFVDRTISFWLGLSRSLLLQGQVWRVISFIFIPFSGGSILSVVLGIYFTWFIGTALEREWGDFRYTVYLLSGVLGTVLGCLLTGVTASTYCLSLSLLLAFAMLFGGGLPEMLVGALGGLLASASSCALSKHHISRIFRDMLSAIAGTLTALIAQLVYPALQVNFAIIGALMVLTPGVALTMGIRDIINSDYLSGTIRLVDALLVAGCLAVGVTLGYTLLSTVTGVVW